jgi:hypothetical protein
MDKPQVIWVLPNRNQSGEEDAIKGGTKLNLSAAIDVKSLPKEIVIGIPEDVLARYPNDDLIFAQYCRQSNGTQKQDIFTLSVTCGVDLSGRTVYLTLLQILLPGCEMITFPSVETLSKEERSKANEILTRFSRSNDKWVRSIKKMLVTVKKKPNVKSFANVPVTMSAFPPEWTPHRKSWFFICIVCGLIILSVLVVFYLIFIRLPESY